MNIISYGGNTQCALLIQDSGVVAFGIVPPRSIPAAVWPGWHLEHGRPTMLSGSGSILSYLPFFDVSPSGGCMAWAPVWFLTTLSVLLLWWVWSKTGPKRPGGAFPVESE